MYYDMLWIEWLVIFYMVSGIVFFLLFDPDTCGLDKNNFRKLQRISYIKEKMK
jgi:hypothetical protein